jgi:hypothetical protein
MSILEEPELILNFINNPYLVVILVTSSLNSLLLGAAAARCRNNLDNIRV